MSSNIFFFGIISRGNETSCAALVKNKIIRDFSSQGQILWRCHIKEAENDDRLRDVMKDMNVDESAKKKD